MTRKLATVSRPIGHGIHVTEVVLCLVLSAMSVLCDDFEIDDVASIVRRWSPMVWLAPGERFMPLSVQEYLAHTWPTDPASNQKNIFGTLPVGHESQKWFLVPDRPLDELLADNSSFLYGRSPSEAPVPVYAVVRRCSSWPIDNNIELTEATTTTISSSVPSFHVTYWFFYPYNQGKDFCSLNISFLGPLPVPQIFNRCLGERRFFGNHVGDWEHVSLWFSSANHPTFMYVATHEAGAYYRYMPAANIFLFARANPHDTLQLSKPQFPKYLYVKNGRPVLFAAKGSHGMWTMPGSNRYKRIPRILDTCGFGTLWETWRNLEIIDYPFVKQRWLHYEGRWGSPKNSCSSIKTEQLGFDICETNNGPTGIPLKRLNFICPKT